MRNLTRGGEVLFRRLPPARYSGLYGQVYRIDGREWEHMGTDLEHAYREYAAGVYGRVMRPTTSSNPSPDEWTNDGTFGNGLCVDVEEGEYRYRLFAHNDRLLAPYDSYIEPDQLVAVSGGSGFVTGPHIHVQVSNDRRFPKTRANTMDPLRLLATAEELEEPMTRAERGLIRIGAELDNDERLFSTYETLARAGYVPPQEGTDLNAYLRRRFGLIALAASDQAEQAYALVGGGK